MSQRSYNWSDASALYEVTHGEAGTARTDSAFRYLERAIVAPAASLDETQELAASILAALRTVRDAETPIPEKENSK